MNSGVWKVTASGDIGGMGTLSLQVFNSTKQPRSRRTTFYHSIFISDSVKDIISQVKENLYAKL